MNHLTNHRAQNVLKILVERYIQEGTPVASKTLAEDYQLGLSPASIRTILADLEERGYLKSPHTSAGRVPTELGYRFFVNHLLTAQSLANWDIHDLKDKLNPEQDMSNLLHSASSLLSGLTQLVGVVALPKRNQIKLQQVDFLSLSSNRVLVILVLSNREVQNRIIHTERLYQPNELQEAANFLNTHYAGKELLTVRQELFSDMCRDREAMAELLKTAMTMAEKALAPTKDYVIAGQNHLLQCTDEKNVQQLRTFFDAFSQKQDILNLLDHSLEAEGIQIFIGKESGYEAFSQCSIVTASYAVDGQLLGSLGVIGPTRMPYDRVITAVDVTSKLLSSALNQD